MINQLNDLVIARRLMIQSQEMLARSKGKDIKLTSAKEAMEEDQLLLSGEVPASQSVSDAFSGTPTQETQINLGELGQKLTEIQNHPETAIAQPQADRNQFLMAYQRTETICEGVGGSQKSGVRMPRCGNYELFCLLHCSKPIKTKIVSHKCRPWNIAF